MPYVKQDVRHDMANGKPAMVAGDLNYAFTLEMLDLLKHGDPKRFTNAVRTLVYQYWNAPYRKQNYQTANDISGALLNSVFEFTRRMQSKLPDTVILSVVAMVADINASWYDDVVAPSEDTKIAENGDVYPV